jgi:hypothetical protein
MKMLTERAWERRWALAPLALLLGCVGGLATMASIAADDPSFSLEPSYYEKAVHWDREQAKRAESARLGWKLEARVEPAKEGSTLVALVTRADGSPLTDARVEVDAFANARAGEVRRVCLEPGKPGEYSARLDAARPGLWEFRFEVEQGSARYSTIARADVGGSRP